jgi:hypothetical protein
MTKIAGSKSRSISQRHGSRIQIQIWIHPKMSWFRNTAFSCVAKKAAPWHSPFKVTLSNQSHTLSCDGVPLKFY